MKTIPIAHPVIGKEEIAAVVDVLKNGRLAQGEMVERFEKNFAKKIGVKHALAVSSGTAALYLALLALGIERGDEVITSPFTFVATVEAILWLGAHPVFVDIDPFTFNIDPTKIPKAITKKTKVILPIHLYGQPSDMNSIMAIAKKHNLKVVEDCAQAHGAEIQIQNAKLKMNDCQIGSGIDSSGATRRGSPDGGGSWKKVGSIGDVGCFSFYATKNITCGEGGAITTNSKQIYQQCLLLRNHGSKIRYIHEILGGNFRLTEMQAALGVVQLTRLDAYNQKRQKNAAFLSGKLAGINGLAIPFVKKDVRHVFHQYTICISEKFPLTRNQFVAKMRKRGIDVQVYYEIPLNKQPFMKMYQKKRQSFPVSEKVAEQVVSLPIHPHVSKKELMFICNSIKQIATMAN